MKFFIFSFLFISSVYAQDTYKEIKALYLESYTYEQQEKYTKALQTLAPLYKTLQKSYTLNMRFAWLFYLDGKYKDSLLYYNNAFLISPKALNPKLGIIKIYLATGSYKEAEVIASEALKVDRHNFYVNLYINQALSAQKKYAIAEKNILKMLALYPNNIFFLEQLALVQEATKNKNLESTYMKILLLNPSNDYVKTKKIKN